MRASGRRKAPVVRGIQSECYIASRHASSNLPSTLATLAIATLATLTAFEQPRLLPGGLAQWHHLRVKVRVGGEVGVRVGVGVRARVRVGVRVRVSRQGADRHEVVGRVVLRERGVDGLADAAGFNGRGLVRVRVRVKVRVRVIG